MVPMSNSRWSRKIWPIAILLRLLAGCATVEETAVDATAINGEVEQFGQWVVGCDNLPICTATALVGDVHVVEGSVYLQMTFTDKIADAQTIAIMRDGKLIEGLSPLAAHNLTEDLLGGTGAVSVYVAENSIRYPVPRGGFAQMIERLNNWRDQQPRRRNAAIPVTPLPASRIEKPILPPTFNNVAKLCPKSHMGSALQAWRLHDQSTLLRASCGNEGINSVNFWFLSGLQGVPSVPISFKDGDGRAQPFNSWFDDATGYLRMTHYFGRWDSYQEDCGIYRAYAWNGSEMQLVQRRYMPACGTGIGPAGWIPTYRATIFNGSDSGP